MLGPGMITNPSKGECCKIGCFCCSYGFKMPNSICNGWSRCLCCFDAYSFPYGENTYLTKCHCTVWTASSPQPLAVGRANSFVVCPPCLCAVAGLLPQLHRGRGIYALRVLPLLCTTTHGCAKDDHSCGRRGRRQRRRWRLERGDAALSASCPPRARANARALESATSPVRPSTSCTGTIASSLAGASGGDERCASGRSRVPSRCSTGGTCATTRTLTLSVRTSNTFPEHENGTLHMRAVHGAVCAGSNAVFATPIRKRARCISSQNRARRAQVPTAVPLWAHLRRRGAHYAAVGPWVP